MLIITTITVTHLQCYKKTNGSTKVKETNGSTKVKERDNE